MNVTLHDNYDICSYHYDLIIVCSDGEYSRNVTLLICNVHNSC